MMDQFDIEKLKVLPSHAAEQAVENQSQLIDEHSASFRWLMASLLAVNGAGLLSLRDLPGLGTRFSLAGAGSFYLGIVFALLIASLGQRAIQSMLGPLSHMALYWRSVALTGELDEEQQSRLQDAMNDAMKFSQWPRRAGYASFAFFTLGLAVLFLCRVPS